MIYESYGSEANSEMPVKVQNQWTLTIFLELRRPYCVGDTGKIGADNFLDFETVSQCPERTSRASATCCEDLRGVGIGQQIHDLGVNDRA